MYRNEGIEASAVNIDSQSKGSCKLPACSDCKRLKVKCVRSDPNNPNSACQRCIKKGINCLLRTKPKRMPPANEQGLKNGREQSRKRRVLMKESFNREHFNSMSMRDQLLSSWKLLTSRDDLRLQLLERYETASLARPVNNVLSRGLFTREQVIRRLKLYRQQLYPRFPAVPCPVEENFEDMMNESPILFHTILDIGSIMASDEVELEQSLVLHNLVLRTVVDEIMIVSVKNMELLKCLVLLTHWYNESELYHQQRLHVLTALAISVSYDLGFGGATIVTSGSVAPAFEQMVAPQATSDYPTLDTYSIWLSVYSSQFQSLMANRRPVSSLWNKYTQDAVNAVMQDEREHPEKYQYPINVWELAKVRHLQERIVLSVFKKNNEPVAPDYSDPVIQFTIQQYDAEIDKLKDSAPVRSTRRDLAVCLCKMFLHQAVMYVSFDESIGRAPFTNFSLNISSGPLSYQAERSFTECVQCSKRVIDEVNCRSLFSIASETSDFWTSLTLCCDVLLKCRACCIFNRYFAAACFVSDADLTRIIRFTSLCDRMVSEFPHCNNAVSFGFFVKLILCHHDARVHYHSTRMPVESFGDPLFIMQMANSAQEQQHDEDGTIDTEARNEKMPLPPQNTRGGQDAFPVPLASQERSQQPQQATPSHPESMVSDSTTLEDNKSMFSMNNSAMLPTANSNGGEYVDNSRDQSSYMGSPFSPISVDALQQNQPQGSELEAPFDISAVDFDMTALNEIDSFWNTFVGNKGSMGPFGLDFPV